MTDPRPPLIGISGRRLQGREIIGMPAPLVDKPVETYFSDYARGVIAGGGIPVYLPLDVDPTELVGRLDGLLLSGGTDIEPEHYGADSETHRFPPDPDRDAFELAILEAATQRELAVLGICRGHQLINVHAGGTLNQDVPTHQAFTDPPESLAHLVSLQPGSVVSGIYGSTIEVNSLHHQTVDKVGSGLEVTARADDGVVEALEHVDLPMVSLQWHPEMLLSRDTDPIFAWLTDAASASRRPIP